MSSETANISLASPPPSAASKKVSPSSTADIRVTEKRKAESTVEGSTKTARDAAAKRVAVRVYLLDVAGAVQIQVREDNSLFELMDAICTIWLDKQERPGDGGVFDHMWQIDFAGQSHCGAHECAELGIPETPEKSTSLSELPLKPVVSTLQVTYDFGSSTYFQIRVLSCSTVGAESAKKFPCEAPKRPADAPFLTDSEIAASVAHRTLLETTAETEFSKRQERVIKAQSRPWSMREQNALHLVSMSGMKFTAAWKALLQHTLLFRSKSTASQKFYGLRRDRRDYADEDDSKLTPAQKARALAQAKSLLRSVRLDCLAARPRVAKVHTIAEYRTQLFKRMYSDYDSSDEDEW